MTSITLLALAGPVPTLCAQFARDLGDLSLEELMQETVTSVSKRAQKRGDTAAAISVLSNDDLIRSGATSIADAMRLVPGANVGAFNSSQWAISVRGLNHLYANKLLVLVDGRAVYTPLFAGVYWDLQQRILEDIDRIEVIRGPGATVWGANAVNGVINVVSSSARETQGALAYTSVGDQRREVGLRYGGQVGSDTYYRVFASQQETDSFPFADGTSSGDRWHSSHVGFRLDHYRWNDSHLVWQSDFTAVDVRERTFDGYNFNTVGRWTRELSSRATVEAQAYLDRTNRNEIDRSRNTIDTLDFTLQSTFGLGEFHDLIAGVGSRHIANHVEQTNPYSVIRDGVFDLRVLSAFVQDDFKLIPEVLTLTSGTKLEHNDFTGFELQPSVRAVLKLAHNQTLWAAVSRAVRTPSAIEGMDLAAIALGGPVTDPDGRVHLPTLVGNTALDAEVLWAHELGYRFRPARNVSLDLAVFHNEYERFITAGEFSRFVPGVPLGVAEVSWVNSIHGEEVRARSHGGEASVTFAVSENWRLNGSYSLLRYRMHLPAHEPMLIPLEDYTANSPEHQAIVRSSSQLTTRTDLDVQWRYVGELAKAPAFLATDARVAFRPTVGLELSLAGQNLFDRRHPEQGAMFGSTAAQVPRSIWAKIAWRF